MDEIKIRALEAAIERCRGTNLYDVNVVEEAKRIEAYLRPSGGSAVIGGSSTADFPGAGAPSFLDKKSPGSPVFMGNLSAGNQLMGVYLNGATGEARQAFMSSIVEALTSGSRQRPAQDISDYADLLRRLLNVADGHSEVLEIGAAEADFIINAIWSRP